MTSCCDIPNPLIRDGVSQGQRQVSALPPDSVKVDETDFADFLVFGYQLSKQIIYYKANPQLVDNQPYPSNNQPDGNWQSFFESSIPVQIALIAKTRPQVVRDTYNRHLDNFLRDRTPKNLVPVLLTWSRVFDQIRVWYKSLEAYPPFLSTIRGLVKSNLSVSLLRLWALERTLETVQSPIRATFYQEFNNTFNLGIDIHLPPVADQTPLKGTSFEARTELDTVFQVLFQNYRQIIQKAQEPNCLTDSLKAQQDHQPHLALYFAFWEVIKPARDDLNLMTQKHLDFFYREVLRLPEKAVKPDRAHLIFELAKFQQDYKLDRGTAFKAGKDASGVELLYKLDEEIIVHKAQIADMKGLFLASQETGVGKPIHLTGVHTSLIANSANGQGSEFPKDQLVKAWQPFGDATRPAAAIGLAISSNLLLLQEGLRTITIKLDIQEKPLDQIESAAPKLVNLTDLNELFQVRVSGAKDWIVATTKSVAKETDTTLVIKVEIAIDQPAIVPCHKDLKQPSLPTIQKPVLLLQVNTEVSSKMIGLSSYHFLRALDITKLTLTVNVDEVRNLVVQNDLAVLDVNKPFQPFGFQPKNGYNFYIGSQEVFQKPLTQLGINVTLERDKPDNWSEIYAAYGVDASNKIGENLFNPGQMKVQALRQKVWKPSDLPINSTDLLPITVNLFSSPVISLNNQAQQLVNELAVLKNHVDLESIESWTPQTQNGFLRLQLTGDSFLHDQYGTVLARQVLAAATSELIPPSLIDDDPSVTKTQRKAVIGAYYETSTGIKAAEKLYIEPSAKPLIAQEPYTPVITSLSLSYESTADYILPNKTDLNQQPYIQLFHLYPFDGLKDITQPLPVSLLPTFLDEGTLYIGIKDLNPPISLPLLFQVAEETANTDLRKADVHWYYLANNTWQPFEQHQIVSDRTNGLITSGIVNLAIPATITTGNTLLSPNLYWIKIAVTERSQAICNIIGVHTQTAQVTFSDRGNDPNHLVAPLPAEAIAKLVEPQPAIKQVVQPYNSFGGEAKETSANYYIRISEHLRHKGRAVTIFDYERLVLERYPEIYKVRCINHSRINDQIQVKGRDNLQELVPSSITLAVIPDLSQRDTTNDLEPKVNINLLDDIRKYLASLSSSWVDIRVVNPRYEAIQVEFLVKFQQPYDANFDYYQRELQRAIIGFLSPWTNRSGAGEIHFGGKVYRSSILNFVEKQPYVDYVLNFQMHQGNQQNIREVVASSSRSILGSVPFGDSVNNVSGHIIKQADTCPPNPSLAGNYSGKLGYEQLDNLKLEL
jgi:hypothetical protein